MDAETEGAIAEVIRDLEGKTKMIIVSHRPGMLKHCDSVFEIEKLGSKA